MFNSKEWVQMLIASCILYDVSECCGVITHIEISHRAVKNYRDTDGQLDYGKFVHEHQDALEAGSAFPDTFYPPTCFAGDFHDISEDTHWTPFINASIYYIRKMEKPWSPRVQKLVAFLYGIVSHQVSDILWHSLGIDQGFIQTMSKMNFHNVYPDAHTTADTGGDVLSVYQLNLDYSNLLGDWYVPVDDLANIYQEFYGETRISPTVITICSQMVFLYKFAARLGGGLFYPEFARKSPFLVDHLDSYFQGGITDMAAWVPRIWQEYSAALENGTESCAMPHNPLFIRCKGSSPTVGHSNDPSSLRNGFYTQIDLGEFNLEDVVVQKVDGGITLRPGKRLKEKVSTQRKRDNTLLFESENDIDKSMKAAEADKQSQELSTMPDRMFITTKAYAQLGSAMAVGDLNDDGFEDLVIGSAGVYPGGVVYVLLGSPQGITMEHQDIDTAANMTIPMPVDDHSSHSLFGSALAIFDLDQDGHMELAVGAPSYKSGDLLYQGRVLVFSVNASTMDVHLRVTVDCEDRFCNLGYTLASADVNNDTHADLVMGSPFSGGSDGEQKGVISFLISSAEYNRVEDLHLSAHNLNSARDFSNIKGNENYSWMGYSLSSLKQENETLFLFGEPGLRKCQKAGCEYNVHDKQMTGAVKGGTFEDGNFSSSWAEDLDIVFGQLGKQLAIGNTIVSNQAVIASAVPGASLHGKILFLDHMYEQAGQVLMVNAENNSLGFIFGDRSFSRFGDTLMFADLNNDGLDEMIVGAPLWSSWLPDGVQKGKVYVYGGGSFPEGDVSGNCGEWSMTSVCPEKRAYRVLTFGENFARFGTKAAVLRSSSKTTLFITASHSSKGARLAGAIGVFDFPH